MDMHLFVTHGGIPAYEFTVLDSCLAENTRRFPGMVPANYGIYR
jgi:hypothetical protein